MWICKPSITDSPMGMRGFNEAYGSWKMICILRRMALREPERIVIMFSPSKVTSPEVGSIRRRMERPTVVLPQPDSPTSPRVSPFLTVKLTLSTACTCATVRWRSPPRTGKYFTRSLTINKSGFWLVCIIVFMEFNSVSW